MNIVISNPKTGKAYSKKTEDIAFAGKKVGEEVELGAIGLSGFSGKIVGGSDTDGFPMKRSLEGTGRRKILIGKGAGCRNKIKGQRKRKTVRGNTVSKDTAQLNIAITKHGSGKLEELLGKVKDEAGEEKAAGEKKEEKKPEAAEKPAKAEEEPKEGKKEEKPEAAKAKETAGEKKEEREKKEVNAKEEK